ncbi:PaaI family thioesterase [Umezawaea sp.]|uniref:PaaI family thioesterase n=1 Tax=Umezawaea sp. TaxID=1955258 RepID=UPI002ED120D5
MTTVDPTALSGLDVMRHAQRTQDVDAPHIGRLLGMSFDEVEEGRVVMSLVTRPDFMNPLGTVHGGIAATLLDSVMGCAVHSTLAPGVGYTTLELKVNYIRSARTDGRRLVGEGKVVHAGRRTATAEGRVVDERGALVAHATTTCLILAPEA